MVGSLVWAAACGGAVDPLPDNSFAADEDDAFGLAEEDKADGAWSWRRVWENTKKKVKEKIEEERERAKSLYERMLEIWNRGIDYAVANYGEVFESFRTLKCESIVEGLSRFNPARKFLAHYSNGAAQCMDQFSMGFVCGMSQMVKSLRTVAVGSIRAAWDHRPACFRTAILAGPLGPAGFAMCGLYHYSKPRVIKMARCVKQLYDENQLWRALWDVLWETGCELAGQITRDVIVNALAGGSGTAAMIGGWLIKVRHILSPAAWLRAAGPVAHHTTEAVMHTLINASDRLSECRDDDDASYVQESRL